MEISLGFDEELELERIDVLENHYNIEHGSTKIIALCTEHPEALFMLHSYVGTVPRLTASKTSKAGTSSPPP